MSIEQNKKEKLPQGQETTDLQINTEISNQPDRLKNSGETITAIEGALETFKSETELTPEQNKEATAREKEELKEIDQTAENAKTEAVTEAVSETRQQSAKSEINAPELPKECEAFFNELSLRDLKDLNALKEKFEAIFTDDVMKEIKINPSFKKETADRYFNALMEQAQWTLESKIAEIENSKKYASAKQKITNAFHSIVEGGKFALAHKAVAVAFKVGTSASALAKMGAGGVTFAFVAGLNHLTGRGYEMVAGKKIPRLAKKLEKELEKQGRLEREQQDIMGGMKDNLAFLMNCDKNRQEQLEIYQAELKNIGEQNLAEIFSGETDEARAKQQQLLKLIQSTQDIKNLTGKEQKTALKERRELIKTAIDSNALDEFITYQMAEEIKRIKIDLVKNNEPVVLTTQTENQIIMQASWIVRRDIDAILADAIAGEKHAEIEKAGKSSVGSFMDKVLGNSDFARKVAEGFKDGVIFSAASDMAGQAYIAFNMGKQALERGIRQRTQEDEVIENSSELYNEVSLAAKSDEEIKRMIDKTDDQLKATKKEDDATEKTKALLARKKQLEQVLALNSDDIQEIIKTARAQNKTGQRTDVEKTKIANEIKKLENKLILQPQLNELKAKNNQAIDDLSELAKDIVLGKGQEIQLAADLANKQKKATSLVGLIGRFHKLTNKEQKQVLLKAGWEAGKAGLFATIGAKMVDMGAQAYKGEGIKLGEHAMGIIDGATFGLGGKMLANLTSKGVAEAVETKKDFTIEEIKRRAKDLQHPQQENTTSNPQSLAEKQGPASTPTIETTQPSTPKTAETTVPPAEKQGQLPTQNEIFEKAQKGDSIWKIADKIRMDMEKSGEIKRQNYSEKGAEASKKWNEAETTRITNEIKNELSKNLKNPDFIKPGQEFKTNENAILQRLQNRGIINEQGQPKGLTESKVKNITENNAKIAELVRQVKAKNKGISDPSKRIKITTGEMIEKAIKGKSASEIIQQSQEDRAKSQKLKKDRVVEESGRRQIIREGVGLTFEEQNIRANFIQAIEKAKGELTQQQYDVLSEFIATRDGQEGYSIKDYNDIIEIKSNEPVIRFKLVQSVKREIEIFDQAMANIKKKLLREEARELEKIIDKDNDGFLSLKEMRAARKKGAIKEELVIKAKETTREMEKHSTTDKTETKQDFLQAQMKNFATKLCLKPGDYEILRNEKGNVIKTGIETKETGDDYEFMFSNKGKLTEVKHGELGWKITEKDSLSKIFVASKQDGEGSATQAAFEYIENKRIAELKKKMSLTLGSKKYLLSDPLNANVVEELIDAKAELPIRKLVSALMLCDKCGISIPNDFNLPQRRALVKAMIEPNNKQNGVNVIKKLFGVDVDKVDVDKNEKFSFSVDEQKQKITFKGVPIEGRSETIVMDTDGIRSGRGLLSGIFSNKTYTNIEAFKKHLADLNEIDKRDEFKGDF